MVVIITIVVVRRSRRTTRCKIRIDYSNCAIASNENGPTETDGTNVERGREFSESLFRIFRTKPSSGFNRHRARDFRGDSEGVPKKPKVSNAW